MLYTKCMMARLMLALLKLKDRRKSPFFSLSQKFGLHSTFLTWGKKRKKNQIVCVCNTKIIKSYVYAQDRLKD